MNFYENLVLYHVLTSNFEEFYNKFKILRRYYTELWEPTSQTGYVNERSIKIVILVLLHLNIANRIKEFEEMYQALRPEIRDLAQFKQFEQFIEYVSIGNYDHALEMYKDASIEFQNMLKQIKEIKKYE
jgi:hypothetical protein